VVTAEEVAAREPDLIIGWSCGKKFLPEQVVARPGFGPIPAVRNQDLYEIKSSLILQPGPAALTDGLRELQKIIQRWAGLTFELPVTRGEGDAGDGQRHYRDLSIPGKERSAKSHRTRPPISSRPTMSVRPASRCRPTRWPMASGT
jgi:hypothetical protein